MVKILFEKEDRERLQESLVILRTVAGWNADEFATLIGVTRQYYSELENHNRDLTQSLHLAIMYVLEKESANNEELKNVLEACLDENKMSKDQCHELSTYIASERKKKTDEINAKKVLTGILKVTTGLSIIGIIVKSITKK